MNHIHIHIKPGSVATFSQEPTKETLEAVKRLIESAEKKLNEPEERYFKLIDKEGYGNTYILGVIYKGSYVLGDFVNVLYSATQGLFTEDWEEVTKQDYINQEAKRENNVFYFDKNNYEISGYWQGDSKFYHAETDTASREFTTEQQCKEALYNHIWDNHKISEKERTEIFKQFAKNSATSEWKIFYCETIIKQQNK